MGSKIEIYTNYIENSLFTYFKYLLGKSYKYSIVKIFITKYIEIRYYDNGIYRDKNLSDKLGKEFKLIAKELMKAELKNVLGYTEATKEETKNEMGN